MLFRNADIEVPLRMPRPEKVQRRPFGIAAVIATTLSFASASLFSVSANTSEYVFCPARLVSPVSGLYGPSPWNFFCSSIAG